MVFNGFERCALIALTAAFAPASAAAQQAQDAIPPPDPPIQMIRVPEPPPVSLYIPKRGTFVYTYLVEVDGRTSNCEITEASGDLVGRTITGPAPCPRDFSEPYRDRAGRPVRKRVTFRDEVTWEELP